MFSSEKDQQCLSASQLLSYLMLHFIQLLLANATRVFLNVKWKAALLEKNSTTKNKDKQGGLHIPTLSLNWTVLSGLCSTKMTPKRFVVFFTSVQSLQQPCCHLVRQQPPLRLSFTWLQYKLVLALASSCLRCFRDVAGLHITIYKNGYSHRSEDCSMYVNYSSAFSLSTHSSSVSCLLAPCSPCTAGMWLKHQLWRVQATIDG